MGDRRIVFRGRAGLRYVWVSRAPGPADSGCSVSRECFAAHRHRISNSRFRIGLIDPMA